jgi:hypothetical protein
MPERSKSKAMSTVLIKWRFVPDQKGESGQARYWWSDGSRTEDKVASYIDAVARLTTIQDNGGVKKAE